MPLSRARCRTPSGQRAIPGHQAPSSTGPVTSAITSGGHDTAAPTAALITPPAAAPDSTGPVAFEVVGECDVPAAHPRGSTAVGGVRPGRGRSTDRHPGGACGCVPNRRQSRIDDDGQHSGPPRGDLRPGRGSARPLAAHRRRHRRRLSGHASLALRPGAVAVAGGSGGHAERHAPTPHRLCGAGQAGFPGTMPERSQPTPFRGSPWSATPSASCPTATWRPR